MTRRVDPRRLMVVGGLALALTGCAARATTGSGMEASGTGASGTGASGVAGAGAAAGSGAGPGFGVVAPGALMFPALPSPKEYDEVTTLRDVHFAFDRAVLGPEGARVLDRNARWLVAHPGTLVLVEGHADERGTNEYNLALGESRARATRDELVARGVAASRITLVSYGEERPVCRGAAEGCWAKNRRAHFLVKPPVSLSALQP